MDVRMIPFIVVKDAKEHVSEIDANEFYKKIQRIGLDQGDHMAITIEGIIPRTRMICVYYDRNKDRDIPDLHCWVDEEQTSRPIAIFRHHKDVWKIIDGYCENALNM